MPTATVPRSTREETLAIVASHLRGPYSLQTRLADLGAVTAAVLLIDLEERFGVLLDPDEATTLGDLATLVAWRHGQRPPGSGPCTLIDLAAERARRARADGGYGWRCDRRDCDRLPGDPCPECDADEAASAPPATMDVPGAAIPAAIPLSRDDLRRLQRVYGMLGRVAFAAGLLAGLAFFWLRLGGEA